METPSQHELYDIAERRIGEGGPEPDSIDALPPVDGGRAAWLFMTGCFIIELVLWGEN